MIADQRVFARPLCAKCAPGQRLRAFTPRSTPQISLRTAPPQRLHPLITRPLLFPSGVRDRAHLQLPVLAVEDRDHSGQPIPHLAILSRPSIE